MRLWLITHSKVLEIFIIISLWVLTIISRLEFHGLVYGLDFGLFHPDGSLYSMQSLIYSGLSENQANKIVNEFYFEHASKHNVIDTSVLYNRPNWQEYKYRILYPLLSVPFVKIMGIYGMLVIPSLTLLALLILPVILSRKKGLPYLGTILAICIISSSTIVRWMFANTSDSLLVLLFVCVVILLSSETATPKLNKILLLLFLVVSSSLTRFSLLIWLSIAVVLFYLGVRLIAGLIFLTSVIFTLPVFVLSKSSSILPSADGASLVERIFNFPIVFLRVFFYELGQLFVLDKVLLFGLVAVIVTSITNHSWNSSKFFLAVLLALFITGSLNGVLGVNFRYQIPILPFMVWVAIDAVIKLIGSYEKRR